MPAKGKRKRDPQGVQGVEIGLDVVGVLVGSPVPMALKEIARATNLPPNKVHRYLVSLCRRGLLQQDVRDGRYDLGKMAIAIGLAAQGRLDEFRLADEALQKLHAEVQLPIVLAAWGNHGPTIVRRIEPLKPIVVTAKVGFSFPVLNTSAGRLFAAFLPADVVAPVIQAEFSAGTQPTISQRPIDRAAFSQLLERIRAERFSLVKSDYITGADAMAAPIFDSNGGIVLAIVVLAPAGSVDTSPNAATATALRRVAAEVSERLGFRAKPARNISAPD